MKVDLLIKHCILIKKYLTTTTNMKEKHTNKNI